MDETNINNGVSNVITYLHADISLVGN